MTVANGELLISRNRIFPASEASKRFGEIRKKAAESPIFVSGRSGIETVIIGIAEYERMALELSRLEAAEQSEQQRATLDFDSIASVIANAASNFPSIKRAYVFGSYARGSANAASDIDVRVELIEDKRFNLRDLASFSKLIEQKTGKEVDVISAREIKNTELAASIEKEKVLVYEREE